MARWAEDRTPRRSFQEMFKLKAKGLLLPLSRSEIVIVLELELGSCPPPWVESTSSKT
jgi:hypothetical protein